MVQSSTFHKSQRKYTTNNYSNVEPSTISNTLKESFAIGVGVSTANEVVSRAFTTLFGPRKVEIGKNENVCNFYFDSLQKCLKGGDSCSDELEKYEKCMKN